MPIQGNDTGRHLSTTVIHQEGVIMPRRKIERPVTRSGKVIDMKTGKPEDMSAIPFICERVRFYRERLGLEQKELAARLGITGNAVCNWENGRSRPDISLVPALCDILGISLYELFGMDNPFSPYTAGEQMLIERYRSLSSGHKTVVVRLVDGLSQAELSESTRAIRRLPCFSKPLAAGIGDPTEFDDSADHIYVYDSPEVSKADYIFRVNGDSMEPEYHNDDLVLVRRNLGENRLIEGEIAAFIVGNETYIKVYGTDGLYSLNTHYAPMHFCDAENVYLIGKVIGKLDSSEIATGDEAGRYDMMHRKN